MSNREGLLAVFFYLICIASRLGLPQIDDVQVVRTAAGLQKLARRWRGQRIPIGLVPTMGYLHEGHLSLVHAARQRIGADGRVIVSIYVNPTQFGPQEDFQRYPRDLARDKRLCRSAGVDVVFVPSDDQMYPGRQLAKKGETPYSTYVVEDALSQVMEGSSRPTHFRGVTTVVAKLFNLALPDVAIFGAKDFQQAAIIQRMTRDLNFPLKVIVAPTFREPDGLAMSSRNKYLTTAQREQAVVLWQSLTLARTTVRRAGKAPTAVLKKKVVNLIRSRSEARLDYVEFFHPQTLQPVTQVRRGDHMALAVFVGPTRLIDNGRI